MTEYKRAYRFNNFRFILFATALLASLCLSSQPLLVPYRIGGRWGYADTTGKIVIRPEYDKAGPLQRGQKRLVLSKNKMYGIISNTGKVIIPFVYSGIQDFDEGHTILYTGEFYQVLSSNGALSQKFNATYAQPTIGGNSIVRKNNLFGVMNRAGKWIIDPDYDEISSGRHYDFMARNGNLSSCFNVKGKLLFTTEQVLGDAFINGDGYVIRDHNTKGQGVYRFYDGHGRLFLKKENVATYHFVNGHSFIYYMDTVNGHEIKIANVMDTSGRYFLPQGYTASDIYTGNGYFACTNLRTGKMGVVDSSGKFQVPAEYEAVNNQGRYFMLYNKGKREGTYYVKTGRIIPCRGYAQNFTENIFLMRTDSGYNFMDTTGRFLLAQDFSALEPMGPDGTIGTLNNKRHWIDKYGSLMLENVAAAYDEIEPFSSAGYAPVYKNNKVGLVNRAGKEVMGCTAASIELVGKKFLLVRYEMYNKLNVLDSNLKPLLPPNSYDIKLSSDSAHFLFRQDSFACVADLKGNVIIKLRADNVFPMENGLFSVWRRNSDHRYVEGYRHGCVVQQGGEIGGPSHFTTIMDRHGKVIVPEMLYFSGGLPNSNQFIYHEGKGYIRADGKRFYRE